MRLPDDAAGGRITAEEEAAEEEAAVPRDWRAVIVACSGLAVIAVTAIVGFLAALGSIPADFTAVGTSLAAYFGIKAANLAREDSATTGERDKIRTAELAGAEPSDTGKANARATKQIKALGLEARPSVKRPRRGTTRG
jgi:hypothetical protein